MNSSLALRGLRKHSFDLRGTQGVNLSEHSRLNHSSGTAREPCHHSIVRCVNQFELIRKYKCLACRRIVMCQCDETRGRRFFPHQLGQATDLETRSRMPVTGGFQPFVCEECRGLAPTAHPKAAIRGRTSKIKRYYWRELAFRRMEIFTNWAEAHGYTSNDRSSPEPQEAYESAGLQALREIKALHDREPKYVYSDVSQDEIVRTCRVEVLSLVVPHLPGVEGARARVLDG